MKAVYTKRYKNNRKKLFQIFSTLLIYKSLSVRVLDCRSPNIIYKYIYGIKVISKILFAYA